MIIRTVIADDHAMFRQGLAALLQNAPEIELVGQAGDGDQALELIGRENPDLAILDNSMPGLSGLEVVEKLVREDLKTRFVLLTMHTEPRLASQALQSGAAGFLIKESAFEELLAAIQAVMQGNNYVSSAIAVKMVENPGGCRALPLTPREKEILALIASGLTNRQIADRLCISHKTVDTHRTRLMRKLDLHSTAELVALAIKEGLYTP